ncbi:MAG: hypothetical protein L6416_11510, partial [Candidatus Omnitrophica bacterium]|nr:hypothetical protein [Candidatus Omnitrophota bacterium]
MLNSRIQYAVHIQQWQEGTYWEQSLNSAEELLGQDAVQAQEELFIEAKMASLRYMDERFLALELWELVAFAVLLQRNKKGNLEYLSVLDRVIHCIDKQAEKYNFYTGEKSTIYKHSRRTHIAGQLYTLTGRQIIEIARIIHEQRKSHRRQLKRQTDMSEFFIDPVERLSWFERWADIIFGVSGAGIVAAAGVFAWHWHRKRLIFHDYKEALVESLGSAFVDSKDLKNITTKELEFLVKLLIAGKNAKAKKRIDKHIKEKGILLKSRMPVNKIIAKIEVKVEYIQASRKQKKASSQAKIKEPLKTPEPVDPSPRFSRASDTKIPARILPQQEPPGINRRGRLLAKIEIARAALRRAQIREDVSSGFSKEIEALAQVPQFQKDSCLFSIGCGFLTPFFSTTFSLNSVRLGKRIPILCNNI